MPPSTPGGRYGFSNSSGGRLPRNGSSKSRSPPPGNPVRGEFRVVEDAPRAAIGAVQQHLVDGLEVEGVGERVADPAVREDLPPGIEDQGGHAGGPAVRQDLALDPAFRDGGKVVGDGPAPAGELEPEVVLARLEGLHHHVAVPVVVVADAIEIVLAAIDRQVAPPVVGVAAIDDAAPRIHLLDAVGAAAHRRHQRRLLELHLGVVGPRDDRHQPEDQGQLAVG